MSQLAHTARQGRPPKYPWDEWADGVEHTITAGEEFDCAPDSMGVLIRKTARRLGRHVAVSVDGDKVHFQFGGPVR